MNIAALVRIRQRGVIWLLAVGLTAVLCATAPAAAFAMGTDGGSTTNPWIQSDQADYPPGATVTLDGGNWSPGESVHIVVDDTNGHTWSFSDDLTADSAGLIQDSFALPYTFISSYDVTATGPLSGTAATTFTDGNVNVKTAGPASATVDWVLFNTTNCSGGQAGSGSFIATSQGNGTPLPGGASGSQSFQLTAEAVSGFAFSTWSGGNVPSQPNSANPICVPGQNSTQQITATYAAITTRTTSTALARTAGTDPATYGSALTYTATVTASGGNPTNVGTVTFSNGATVLCNAVPLSGGSASCSSRLPAGAASVTAAYSGGLSGSVQFTSSTSSSLAQTVNPKTLTIAGAVAQNKAYDATATATVDFSGASLVGVVSPDLVSIDSSNYSATFVTAGAGSAKAVTVSGVAVGGADAGNYTVSQPSGLTATIGQRSVTASITAAGKTYDGTRTASITGCSLEAANANHGVEPGDTVGCSAANGLFATRNAGAQSVSAAVSLTGSAAANYQLTSASASTTATIAQRSVTASITAADKTYDGTTNASITNCGLDPASGDHGVVSGDSVGCAASNGQFATRDAGTRQVTAGVVLTGAESANYQLTSSTAGTSATISQRSVTATITAPDKTYDGTPGATVSGCTLEAATGNHGVLAADSVGCDGSNAGFGSSHAGPGTVTADVSLTGAESGNYQLTSGTATTSATIEQRQVTASITAADKTYDGTTDATVTGCGLENATGNHGVLSADAVGCDASNAVFGSSQAGLRSVTADVVLTGADSPNYQLASSTAATSATIRQRSVTATITAPDKTYDRTTDATVTGCALENATGNHGVLSADAVGCDASNAVFGSSQAGLRSVTADVALNGADKANYQLTSPTASTTATIDQRPVTATITAADKIYDGTTDATVTGCTLETATGDHGVLAADSVGCDGSNAVFGSSQAGIRSVTADVALNGADKANYQLTSPTASTTATIKLRLVTASITAADKVYDGKTDASVTDCTLEPATDDHGVLSGDSVSCDAANGQFATRNAGSQSVTADVSLTGADGANYQLTSSTAATSASISQRPVTAAISASDKTYDGTTDATVTGCTLEAATDDHGVLSGDSVGCDAANGEFATRDAGTQPVSADVALNGADKGNYRLTGGTATTSATIQLRLVTASITAADKVYDGTADATITGCTLDSASGDQGVLSGETVGCDTAHGRFASEGAGSQSVTADVSLNGADSGNYELTSATAGSTATIDQRPVTATITAADKTYDATADAQITDCKLDVASDEHGVLAGDDVSCQGTAGHFESANAGIRTVTADVGLSGADKGDYELTDSTAATTATIGQAPLHISAVADSKQYDATTTSAATPSVTGADLQGSDSVDGLVQAFQSRNVLGTGGSTLAVTGYVVHDGNGGLNYVVITETASGTISPAPLHISAVTDSKQYDATAASSGTPSFTANDLQGSDTVDGLAQAFQSKNVLGPNGSTLLVTGYVVHDGNGGSNYNVITKTAAGTITAAPLHLSAASDSKQYDATTSSSATPTMQAGDLQGADTVTGLKQAFASPNVMGAGGSSLVVTAYSVNDGNAGSNYAVITKTASGTISQAPLHLSAVPDARQYNGTTSSNGTPTVTPGDLQGSDSVAGLVQAFQSKNVLGVNASVLQVTGYVVHDGNGGGNYSVSTSTAQGSITPAPLHLLATSDTKQYDGTTSSNGTPTVKPGDLQAPDTVTGLTQSFGSKNVLGANASTLQINSGYVVHDGNGGNNYSVSAATATGTITAKPLTVTGITAANKAWDASTTATLNTSGATLNGVVTPDSVGLDTGAAAGTFANSAVGTWTVQIAGLALTGTDKGNYSLTQATTTASIGAWYATGFYDPVGISSSLFVPAPGSAPAATTTTIWNTVKGGSTVPLKFNLYASQGGSELKSTASISTFDAVKLAACAGDSGDPVDFVTTGNTSLRYDSTGMQFIQNWKTPTGAANTCYRVDVKFLDGSAVYAFFKLTK